jgi:hypothetical protein
VRSLIQTKKIKEHLIVNTAKELQPNYHISYKQGFWIFAQTYIEIYSTFEPASKRVLELNNTIRTRVFKVEVK